jgi:CheY-like chemotaxis protein
MNNSRQTILIVDDTPENIDLLAGLLGETYQIKAAVNGEKALQVARGEPAPDIILLDITMPDVDGYEVCKELKSDSRTQNIPVIFVSARTDAEDEQRGLSLGAVDYITKPFNPDIVKTRIRTQLDIAEKERTLAQENQALKEQIEAAPKTLTDEELVQLLQHGEDEHLEFKSTLRWNLHADKSDSRIENQCLKTVAAYLNSESGILLIGVDDDGQLLGLDKDHFRSEDKFLLHWHNLLREYLGAEMAQLVRSTVRDLNGKRVLIVQCGRSPRPVFFRRDNDEAFYVRMGNTSQALKPSELLAYVDQRYGNAR